LGALCALTLSSCCPLLIHAEDTPKDALDQAEAAEAKPRSLRPEIRHETLPNGLKIYLLEDHAAPLVSYQVWFDVGARNEHEAGPGQDHGITGLSHFFEHLMFRGTSKHPKFFDEIYALGGKLNAFTWLDETVYWENMPSQHLERVIAMEADRLEHTTVDFLNLEPEREVVKSERLLRTENQPEGLAWERLQARAFVSHPYHWKTIGWMSDLNAITVKEANDYHQVFYAPNNATIIVSGDHDSDQTLAWIRSSYGHLKPRDLPSDTFALEPRQASTRRDRVFKATDPQVVMWGYRAPAPTDPDFAVLEIIDRVLTDGKSSRLQKSLVYATEPKLSRLYAYLMPIRDPYLYVWGATLQPNMTVRELEAAVDAEVTRLLDAGITEVELKRAVAKLRSDVVRENLSNQKKGEYIGFSLRATDSPYTFFDRLETYGRITVADVKRVAQEVLRPSNRTVVPVVDPSRYTALIDAFIAAAGPGLPTQPASALKEAVGLTLTRHELNATQRTLNVEQDAIHRLTARALVAKEGAPEEEVAKIDTYLTDNEKGAVKRQLSLDSSSVELKTARRALAKRLKAHRRSGRALRRMRWNPSQVPAALALSLIDGLMSEGPRKIATLDTSEMLDGALPLVVAYEALLAWVLEDAGQHAAAAVRRASAIALAEPALKTSRSGELEALLRAALALAWDTQVTGVTLTDAETSKSKRGARRSR
jgi:zinc protease